MMISNLPVELQNKIFYYCAEHPCAKMIKNQIDDMFRCWPCGKDIIYEYGCLYYEMRWFDDRLLMRTQKNIRWRYLLEELGGIINIHTHDGLEPIDFDKFLNYTTRLKINDAEKKWLRHHFRNSKQVLVKNELYLEP